MTEGALVPSLGSYLLVKWSRKDVMRLYFSSDMLSEQSDLAEGIVAHLERGSPCPRAELDMPACTKFQKRIYAQVQAIPRGKTRTCGEVAACARRRGQRVLWAGLWPHGR